MTNLALNFTTATLDPSITFTRSTSATNPATFINSSGYVASSSNNAPRFNYDPVTLACKGLLIEAAQTNLNTYSNGLKQAVWNQINVTTTENNALSPDNGTTAATIYETAASGEHQINNTGFTFLGNTAYTVSGYVKPIGGRNCTIFWFTNSVNTVLSATFNITNGTIVVAATAAGSAPPTNVSARITPEANGFYRVSLTGTTVATAGATTVRFHAANGTSNSYAGDVTKGIIAYGAQVEAANAATSLIPTSGATRTRNADVATITGSNFTSFWNATQGGATVQATPSIVSGITPLVQFDDGTANEIIALRGNTTNPELYIVDGGTPQTQLDAGTIAANTAYSLTGWWATNDCRARQNSGAAVTDATATIPTVTQARIGSDGTNYLNGTIATINYYAAFSSQIYTRRKNKVVSSLF